MGSTEDKIKRNRRRKNYIQRELHKMFKQKDHSPDEVYDRNKYKKVKIDE